MPNEPSERSPPVTSRGFVRVMGPTRGAPVPGGSAVRTNTSFASASQPVTSGDTCQKQSKGPR